MIKATPNYPLCISARPGPSWCVRGLFWKKGQAHFQENFPGCLFPHARGDPRFALRKIFRRVSVPACVGVIPASPSGKFSRGFFIRSSAFSLSTCSSRFAYSRRFPGRRLQPHCPWLCPPPQNFAELPSLGHLVPGYARFSLWKIFHGPGGKALCGENICLCSETALYKYVG